MTVGVYRDGLLLSLWLVVEIGVVFVGEAAAVVEVGRGVTVEALYSTDGGTDNFLLFGSWGRESQEAMLGSLRVKVVKGEVLLCLLIVQHGAD